MTKKDFIAIANVIKKSTVDSSSVDRVGLLMGLTSYFKTSNPNFNHDKFLKESSNG